jgi:hypothetical protein
MGRQQPLNPKELRSPGYAARTTAPAAGAKLDVG